MVFNVIYYIPLLFAAQSLVMSSVHSASFCLCERTVLSSHDFSGEECSNRMELEEKLLHLRPQGMHQRWAEAECLSTVGGDDKPADVKHEFQCLF